MTPERQTDIQNPTWWEKRTIMEGCLTLSSTIAGIIGIWLVILIYNKNLQISELNTENHRNTTFVIHALTDKNQEKVCLSPGCIHTASRLLEYMDENVDPCHDFYNFTCGKFVKNTNIPDDKSSVTSFIMISDILREQLRPMIEEPIQPNEPKHFQLSKKLYRACMNKTLIEKEGLNTIHEILKELGGWPVLEGNSWNEGDFDWRKSVYKFRKVGYSVNNFMGFSVGVDVKNSTKRIIDLDQASLTLSRELLTKGLDDEIVKAYYDYMIDIAVLFGADRKRAEAELSESLQFEMKLANISLPSEKLGANALYNPMSIKQLQTQFPSIPWLEYINNILAPDTEVTSDEIVIVKVPSYIKAFEALINETSKRVQANYVMWRATESSVPYLNEKLRRRQLDYTTVVTGITESESRWKECIDVFAGSLSEAASTFYVRKHYNEEAIENANNMIEDIRTKFYDILRKVEWMDAITKVDALQKAKAMDTHIAHAHELLDDEELEKLYDGLELDSENYMRSILNVARYRTRNFFKNLRQPVNNIDWLFHSAHADVNIFYSTIHNSIRIPAGILQGVFFNADRPRYMNYGAIGSIIGHEIAHGFGDLGRQYDQYGNLFNWWREDTKMEYDKIAQCIIDQYGNYTLPELGLKLNGKNTHEENIADNGGIKQAYLAYESWLDKNGEEKELPGLEYSGRQMFWISAASIWCSKMRKEELRPLVEAGEHVPYENRVINNFLNMPYFAKDFKCRNGSKMNPRHKCKVW